MPYCFNPAFWYCDWLLQQIILCESCDHLTVKPAVWYRFSPISYNNAQVKSNSYITTKQNFIWKYCNIITTCSLHMLLWWWWCYRYAWCDCHYSIMHGGHAPINGTCITFILDRIMCITSHTLTHIPFVLHISISELGQHWFKQEAWQPNTLYCKRKYTLKYI